MMPSNSERLDVAEIEAFLDELSTAMTAHFGPRSFAAKCSRFFFHVTDVTNVSSILMSGRLLSGFRARQTGELRHDSAARNIVAQTDDWVKQCVRLYFRLRTDTFFHTEGIRPIGQRSQLGVHCPVPVAFLLDAGTVLSLPGVRLTDGNAARNRRRRVGRDLAFLRSLPFEWIYQDTRPRTPEEQDLATFHRQAEVLVPNELALDPALRFLYVRSPAERETLRTLLREVESETASRWANYIQVDSRAEVFFKRWTFVKTVYLDAAAGRLLLHFNQSSTTPAPFAATLFFQSLLTEERIEETTSDFRGDRPVLFRVPAPFIAAPFHFRFELDGCLAYANDFDPTRQDELVGPVRTAD